VPGPNLNIYNLLRTYNACAKLLEPDGSAPSKKLKVKVKSLWRITQIPSPFVLQKAQPKYEIDPVSLGAEPWGSIFLHQMIREVRPTLAVTGTSPQLRTGRLVSRTKDCHSLLCSLT
jgi:hypothetical protein